MIAPIHQIICQQLFFNYLSIQLLLFDILSTEEDTSENLNVLRTDEIFASTGVRKFEARGVHVDGWGRDKFISNSILRDPANGLIVNNKAIFRVEITVFGDLGKQHVYIINISTHFNILSSSSLLP